MLASLAYTIFLTPKMVRQEPGLLVLRYRILEHATTPAGRADLERVLDMIRAPEPIQEVQANLRERTVDISFDPGLNADTVRGFAETMVRLLWDLRGDLKRIVKRHPARVDACHQTFQDLARQGIGPDLSLGGAAEDIARAVRQCGSLDDVAFAEKFPGNRA